MDLKEDGDFYHERRLSPAWQGDPSALDIVLKVDTQYTMCTGEVFATLKQKDHVKEIFYETFFIAWGSKRLAPGVGKNWLVERSLLYVAVLMSVSRSENVSRENVPEGRSGRREEDHNEPDDYTKQVGGCNRRDPWS